MGAKEIVHHENEDNPPPEISFNDEGQKILKYRSHGNNITATVLNKPSEEAIKAANKVFNELFYKFNPKDLV
ncbi:hypothetical protein [Paenibacillus sp. JJ1722]|uniref:hypothetical protein n=1 Tax=Paenibacillus sp. JJ1722 TaxID=3398770 RepID=UPI003AB0120B